MTSSTLITEPSSASSMRVETSTTENGDHETRPEGIKAAKSKRNTVQGKSVAEYTTLWEMKKEDLAMKERLSKLAILDTLLAKSEPLTEAKEIVKNKLLAALRGTWDLTTAIVSLRSQRVYFATLWTVATARQMT
uniref:No apical meristem-associated C-terminal domain-containing protein n=1 Tax=Brassica oleracea var. oleracea TaxID=109376 RepID=A0A0D3AFG7_BRAOL